MGGPPRQRSSLGRVIQVSGPSMFPYLRDRDLVWLNESKMQTPAFGQIVYALRGESKEPIVHRVFLNGQMKGDRTKQWDHEMSGKLEMLGAIDGRIILIGSRFMLINYSSPFIRASHRIQARISKINQWKYPLVHKLASRTILILGYVLRWIENSFFVSDFN